MQFSRKGRNDRKGLKAEKPRVSGLPFLFVNFMLFMVILPLMWLARPLLRI